MRNNRVFYKSPIPILCCITTLFLFFGACNKPLEKENPVDKVLKIKELSQLGTVEFKVSKIISGTDDLSWYKVGGRKILFSCEALIKAGIDFSKLKKEDISIENKLVSLKLPKAEIIYIKIDHNTIKEEYKETGMFRSEFSNKEKDELLVLGEKSINEALPNMGIIVSAESNAKLFLNSYLKASGFKDVSVEFY
jgi:hypothetical protein